MNLYGTGRPQSAGRLPTLLTETTFTYGPDKTLGSSMMDCVPHLEVLCPQAPQEAVGVFVWLITYLEQINEDLHRHQEAYRGFDWKLYDARTGWFSNFERRLCQPRADRAPWGLSRKGLEISRPVKAACKNVGKPRKGNVPYIFGCPDRFSVISLRCNANAKVQLKKRGARPTFL